jgi:hypothetical protein
MGMPIYQGIKRLDTIVRVTSDEGAPLTLATDEPFYVTGSGGWHIPEEEERFRNAFAKQDTGIAGLFDGGPSSYNCNAVDNQIDALYGGIVDGVSVNVHVNAQSTPAARTGEDLAHGRRYDSLSIEFKAEGTVPEGFERILARKTKRLFDDMYVHTGVPRLEPVGEQRTAERTIPSEGYSGC